MKHISLIAILFLFVLPKISAQNPNAEIVGNWKVVGTPFDTKGLSKNEIQKMQMFKDAFFKSKFTFKSDRNFSFDIEIEDIIVKNGHWKYNEMSKSYIVQEWIDKDKERSVLMEIIVEKKDGKYFFILSETPFVLEVQKEL